MTTPAQATQADPGQSVNGTAPGAAAEECADCVTGGERALAILGLLIAAGIGLIATDLLLGGRLSALAGLGKRGTADDDTDAGA
jgi:hypothetical protein